MLNVDLDWFEVFLVVIGAVLGFLLSIVTTIVNKEIDKLGKVRIFYKYFYVDDVYEKARIETSEGSIVIDIPIWFELQNTSNSSRVIRDVCLCLYYNGKLVDKMIQIESSRTEITTNGKTVIESITNYGSDKNSYSFVIPPMSIQKQECEFTYEIPISDINKYSFDQIRFSYYDEKNRIMECVLCDIPNGWHNYKFCYNNEYIQLKCRRKKHSKQFLNII